MGEVDTVTAEIVRSAIEVAVEEASVVVVRASHSTFIQEGADACCALLDAEGRLVAQSAGTTLMHASSLRCSLPALLEDVPIGTMRPGELFALNDPYRGGIHANDIIVFRPILAGDRVAWFAGTLIHVADVGGVAAAGLAALATDTFLEGLLLPPVRLDETVLRIIARNSRMPEMVLGDVHALMAGVNVLCRRVEQLHDEHTPDVVAGVVAASLTSTERRMRDELRRLTPGTYTGTFTVDGDGLVADRTFDVVVTATVGDGSIELDLTGTSAQAVGAVNSSFSQTLSGAIYAVRTFVDPSIPMNEGCWAPVRVVLPEGTLVNPAPPAACGGRLVTVTAVVDAIIDALSGARPERAVAASGLLHVWAMSGTFEGRDWLSLFYEYGGIGARVGSDGPDATGPYFLGGRSVIPQLEPLESQYPFVVESAGLRPDSGGAGRWRGGLGVETVIRMLAPARVTVRGDRMRVPPRGIDGGAPGAPGSWTVRRADGSVEELLPRQVDVQLHAGDVLVVRTSGGGGVGDPGERDRAAIAADIENGRVHQ